MRETYSILRRSACIHLLKDSLLEENINLCKDIIFLKQRLKIAQAPKDMSASNIEKSELLQNRIIVLTKSNRKVKSC